VEYPSRCLDEKVSGRSVIGAPEPLISAASRPFAGDLTADGADFSLALLRGLPWLAHFRDPWVTGMIEEARQENMWFKINRALERVTISPADAVVCVTEERAELIRVAYDQMAAAKFAVVMRGHRVAPFRRPGR
jgi:hypothetical protein